MRAKAHTHTRAHSFTNSFMLVAICLLLLKQCDVEIFVTRCVVFTVLVFLFSSVSFCFGFASMYETVVLQNAVFPEADFGMCVIKDFNSLVSHLQRKQGRARVSRLSKNMAQPSVCSCG